MPQRESGGPHSAIVLIEDFYRPGMIGRIVEMHARYYARASGFGQFFEAKVAADLSAFSSRLDRPHNKLWTARRGDSVLGSIAIDGEDLGRGLGGPIAHLRWFIVDDGIRGEGVGWRLLSAALAFCDERPFSEVHLWTFEGLHAARRLYEASGFRLADQKAGRNWGVDVAEQRFIRCRP